MLDPETAIAFSVFENKGIFALLLGSGVSRAAQIPTGWEITLDLIRRIAGLQKVKEQPDWAVWYREKFHKDPNYSDLLDALAVSPDERRSILHKYIEPTAEDVGEGRKVPTRAHAAIARLVRDGFIRVIITANFDRLIENALRELGIEPTVIKSDDDLRGAVPLVHSVCFVVKVHGDYLDTRIKNTESELGKYSRALDKLLDRILDEHGLIICGWSAEWDYALRSVIMRAPNRRYPMYWATRGPLSQLATDVVQQRKGRVITIQDADSFFANLQQRIELQAEGEQHNPRSVELLVAAAKKYIGKPEYRIQLDELIDAEVRQLAGHLRDEKLGTQGQWSDEEFRWRVKRFETITEPLARILCILGRWGDGNELRMVAEILQELASPPSVGGSEIWIAMRTYPAVLVLYAYGLGALKAGRYGALYQWLTTKIHTSRRDATPPVNVLFQGAWEAGKNNWWQHLNGLDRRATALSDHLHEVFKDWAHGLLFTDNEFTLRFETFEFMASLAHMTVNASAEELEAAQKSQAERNFVWFPHGRIAWHREFREIILAELSDPAYRNLALDGGFAHGLVSYLSLALENARRVFARYEWM